MKIESLYSCIHSLHAGNLHGRGITVGEDILGERLSCEPSVVHTPRGWMGEHLGPEGEM